MALLTRNTHSPLRHAPHYHSGHFRRSLSLSLSLPLLALYLSPVAEAQLNNQWVTFVRDPSRLAVTPTSISNDTTSLPGDTGGSSLKGIETDMAWADLDKDGDTDLVIVRKQPFTSAGKRTNMLLMNENGVLQDRTSLYATASDVGGDQGFLTPTNDRDVVIADLDGDGWLDVVTATTISDGDPKYIGHPRVYHNLGNGPGGWLGLRFENGRIPQLVSYSTNLPENPRFCSVAVGDVTGDDSPDLYFGDYDSSGAGGVSEPGAKDLNDRLLINDGNGFFTDQSQLRMTPTMLLSAFSMAAVITDINLDGVNDVLKDTALNPPQYVGIAYNNSNNEGYFSLFDTPHTFSPYHLNTGDLNNDGRLDIVVSDDNQDRYRYNLNSAGLGGMVQWGSAKTFTFLSGGDDGFGSNNLMADLDGDGWKDVMVCDLDVDIPGSVRRFHIYHNPGGVPGSQITLLEERQSATGNNGAGWIGAAGFSASDMIGAHDVAVFDLDKDGDLDLVLSRSAGTYVWMNQTDPSVCQVDMGAGGPGNAHLSACGTGLGTGQTSTLELTNAAPNQPAYLFASLAFHPTPVYGGTLATVPVAIGPVVLNTGAAGTIAFPISGGQGPLDLYVQYVIQDPAQTLGYAFSNAVKLHFMP